MIGKSWASSGSAKSIAASVRGVIGFDCDFREGGSTNAAISTSTWLSVAFALSSIRLTDAAISGDPIQQYARFAGEPIIHVTPGLISAS